MNKELETQNDRIIKEYINNSNYSDRIKGLALKRLQDNDFYITGLYELLLGGISFDDELGNIKDQIKDIEGTDYTDDERLQNYIRDQLGTAVDDVDEMFNERLGRYESSIKEVESRVLQTNEQILAQVKSIEISGRMAEKLNSLLNQIKEYATKANNELTILRRVSADDLLKYLEKLEINPIIMGITSEVESIVYQVSEQSIDTTTYRKAYNDLTSYISDINYSGPETSNIDSDVFMARFEDYYNARNGVLMAMYNKLKEESLNASLEVVDASLSTLNLNSRIIDARNSISRINKIIEDAMKDGKFSPSEKRQLKRYYDEINDEVYPEIESLATKYNQSYSNVSSKHSTLVNYVNSLEIFRRMEEYTYLNSTSTLANTFGDFYNASIQFYTEVLTKNRDIINSIDENIESYSSSIDVTDKRIQLLSQSVQAYEDMIKVNQAHMDITSKGVTIGARATEITRIISESMQAINSIGENLYVVNKSKPGRISESTGEFLVGSIENSRVSDWISVPPLMDVVLAIYKNYFMNTIKISYYDVNKAFISIDTYSSSNETFSIKKTTPAGTAFVMIEVKEANDLNIKFEIGSIPTNFALSFYDLSSNIVLARERVAGRQKDHDEFDRATLEFNAKNYATKLYQLVEDNKITPLEKTSLSAYLEDITEYHDLLIKHTTAIGMDTENLTDNYQVAMSEFFMIISDMNSTTTIDPALNINNLINRYMVDLKVVSTDTLRGLRELLRLSKEDLAMSSESAHQAEIMARELLAKIDRYARIISNLKIFYQQENMYRLDIEENLSDFLDDGVLTAVEKVYVNSFMSEIQTNDEWYTEQADRYNISKAQFERTRADLVSYMKPFLGVASLNTASAMDKDIVMNKFRTYLMSKDSLLIRIISAAEADYQILQNEVNSALALAREKNEELIIYRDAISEATKNINHINDTIKELNDAVFYKITLLSTRGDKFMNGVVDTELIATIERGIHDITEEIKPEHFVWTKYDKDGKRDDVWNRSHEGVGNRVQLTHEDVSEKAVFEIEILQESGSVISESERSIVIESD